MPLRNILTAFFLMLMPFAALAQTAATLVADQVTVTDDQKLIASGSVEVLFDGMRLSASAITYDQASDRLTITGPILIRTADGTVFTADSASLDPRLENGILIGARLVLADQLQLAANQIDRVDGRYTQLSRVAATSCNVCANRSPLWEIRADRVIHDEDAQQLYFDNATFHIRGTPVFWLPRMRLPDPTLTRATGLLIPRFRSTDQLGLGVKLPYFIRLGDSRDLTVTPYFSDVTKTLELRYRQTFVRGNLQVDAAASRDSLTTLDARGYLFLTGDLDLGAGFKLDFGLQQVSDTAYLLDYGYADKDRLENYARLSRVRQDDLFLADFTIYETLRDGEVSASLPPLVTEIYYERKIYPDGIGGTLTFGAGFDSYYRTDNTAGDAGRDVARIGASVDWQRSWVTAPGLVVETYAGYAVDAYRTWQDPAYDATSMRQSPNARVVLRFPLATVGPSGATHILEPMIALGWSDRTGGAVANEDSRRVEFDEGNLLAFDHFPGSDAVETGLQTVAGLTWSRQGQNGVQSRLTFGRLWRSDSIADFTVSSGLDGDTSDWLLAGQIIFPTGLAFDGRTLLDDSFAPIKSAARIAWNRGKVDLDASYVWLIEDAAEDRTIAVSEWTFDGDYQINEVWSAGLSGRYDLVAQAPARAGLRIGWQNECVQVELSASRRYTSSSTVDPSTDFGLSVGLNGFSAGRSGAAPRRVCSN